MTVNMENGSITPKTENGISKGSPNVSLLEEFLKSHPEISFIRHEWLDYSGVLRVKILPKKRALQIAMYQRPIIQGHPVIMSFLVDGSYVPGSLAAPVKSLSPDWTSLKPANFGRQKNRYASVMCYVPETGASDTYTDFSSCPRSILTRVLRDAKQEHGVEFLVGFELEFCLVNIAEDGSAYPLESEPGNLSAAGLRSSRYPFIEECIDDLEAAGIEVQDWHSECAHGGYEIATGPLAPVQAIDALLLSHEIIRNNFNRHGCRVTFHPKPFLGRSGLGTHTHISMQPTSEEKQFLAGMLRRLPALCAFTMPSFESYARAGTHGEAGGWVAWGSENRCAPIRKVAGEAHWEMRCVDATCNMYLAVAAMLGAGLLGIRHQEKLIWGDLPSSVDDLDEHQRRDLNVLTPLPGTLREALTLLKESELHGLDGLLGVKLISEYVAVREREESNVKNLSRDQRISMYLRLF